MELSSVRVCLLVSKEPAAIYAVYLHILLAFYAEVTFYNVSSLSLFPQIHTDVEQPAEKAKISERIPHRYVLKKDISGCQCEIVIKCTESLLSVHFSLLRGLC